MAPIEKQREWALDERRLQPAYDDISNGKLKSADALVRSHLKKKPTSQAALALKVYLTERFSSPDAAGRKAVVVAYEEVVKTGELSGRSLWWVGLGLRNAERSDLALSMYQAAWKQSPDDPELGEQVFLNAVSNWNLEVMTSCSRKMFNAQKGVWGRVAAWAEWVSKSSMPPTADRPFPPPSDPTAFKAAVILLSTIKSTSAPSSDHQWLHMQIYQSAGMEDQALQLVRLGKSTAPSEGAAAALDSTHGQTKDEELLAKGEAGVARAYWRIMFVQELRWRRFGDALVLTIPTHPGSHAASGAPRKGVDAAKLEELWKPEWEWAVVEIESERLSRNYLLYRHLLQATIALQSSSGPIVETTRERLRALDENIGKGERAPLLALLELDVLLRLNGLTDQVMAGEDRKRVLELFWTRWGAKGSIVEDLRHLVQEVGELDTTKLNTGDSDLEKYLRMSNAVKWANIHRDPKSLTMDEARRVWKLYLDGLQPNIPKTDIQPADELGLLTVEMLLHLHRDTQDEIYVLRAVLCLRYMVKRGRSPGQKRAHFMLIRLYRLIGAPSIAVSSLGSVEIQEIQLDSLLHYYAERSSDSILGQADAAVVLFHTKAEKMYKRSSTDLPEHVKSAMQHESYSRIPGLRDLTHRLSTSLSKYSLAVEEIRLKILKDGVLDIPPILEKLPAVFSYNRDWDLLPRVMGDQVQQSLRFGEEEIDGEWVKAWTRVLGDVSRWSNGQAIEAIALSPHIKGITPAERSYLEAVLRVLRAIQGASASPEVASNGSGSIGDLFDASIQHCQQSGPSRLWDTIYPCLLLVELMKMVEIILKRMQDFTKPKKGRKPSQALLTLIEEIKAAQSSLQKGKEGILENLERIEKGDEERRGMLMDKAMIPDDEEAQKEVAELLSERKKALENLRTLLGT